MRKTPRRPFAVAVVMVVTTVMVLVPASPALAYSEPPISELSGGTVKLAYHSGGPFFCTYRYTIPSGKLKNLKSSKKGVVVATQEREAKGKPYVLELTLKKTGTAKVSYTYKGKKHTVKIKAVKWQNPVESLTVGKQQLAKTYGDSDIAYTAGTLSGEKVRVVPAKGWQLVSLTQEWRGKEHALKNGKKCSKRAIFVYATLYNAKTNVSERVIVVVG